MGNKLNVNATILRALSLALLVGLQQARAENWPCFRGLTRQGVSTETNLPLTWSATENIVWKAAVTGDGWSSPIVWEDRVYLTATRDEGASCWVLAFERATGKAVWEKEVFKQNPGHKQERNGYATPTPCTDGDRVYTVFGDGSFAAVNRDGTVAWVNRDFPFYGEHGLGTSPILWNELLIMARDGSNELEPKKLGWQVPWEKSYLLALDRKTGRLQWKGGRGLSRIAHVVPNIWAAPGGRAQVISGAGDVVQGFDALTGERLWSSKNIGEGVVPSIVLGNGLAFTASGWSGRESIKAFRLGGRGDLGETNLAWEQRKGMPHIPSFLYLEPHLYGITEGGVAICLKADTGEMVWQERVGGNFSASPIAAEGRIYFLSDTGETTVIAAGPEFKVVARNALGEKTQASVAVSQKQLFIRTAAKVYCIGREQ
jgi:outer membrane protein assembly factor BamB